MLNLMSNPRLDDAARLAEYARFRAFFDGDQWSSRPQRGEHRLTVNYARTLVRKVASYVFGGPLRYDVLPSGADDRIASRAERELAAVIRANNLDALDASLCITASVLGDAAMKITWDIANRQPAVVAVDPAGLSVDTAPGMPHRIQRLFHTYAMTADQIAPTFAVDLPGIRMGNEATVSEIWTDAYWEVQIDGVIVREEPNPFGWIPYVLVANNPRTDSIWGESDLVDLIAICREINSRMTVLSRVLEFSGAPIAVLENVEGADAIQVGPGAMWEIPEGSKAYLLDLLQGGGVGLHIEYINLLYRSLHDLSETPRTAFGDSGRALSGAALEVEIQPLVQKVRRKRQTWGGVHRERNRRLLDLLERFGGVDIGGLRETETIWSSVLPSDIDSSVRNAVSLVGSGIQSRRTAWASLGGTDPEAELVRIREEASAE